MPWDRAVDVWDALMTKGRAFDIHAAGMLGLVVARVEAGLLLIEVDFNSSKKALIEAQKYTPFEMGLGRLVQADQQPFVGRRPPPHRPRGRAAPPSKSPAARSTGLRWKRSTTGRACRRSCRRSPREWPYRSTRMAGRSAGR